MGGQKLGTCNPQDGCITTGELTAFIDSWKYDSTAYPMWETMGAVGLWRSGEECT